MLRSILKERKNIRFGYFRPFKFIWMNHFKRTKQAISFAFTNKFYLRYLRSKNNNPSNDWIWLEIVFWNANVFMRKSKYWISYHFFVRLSKENELKQDKNERERRRAKKVQASQLGYYINLKNLSGYVYDAWNASPIAKICQLLSEIISFIATSCIFFQLRRKFHQFHDERVIVRFCYDTQNR